MGGHVKDRKRRSELMQPAPQLVPPHSRHNNVRNHQADIRPERVTEQIECSKTVWCLEYVESLGGQCPGNQGAHLGVIIHDEDPALTPGRRVHGDPD